MRKLIKKLQRWYRQNYDEVPVLTKWQRDNIYDFIIDFIKGVKK